ncbi:uncharacterized protein A1O9_07458 [Exophiala aquamarina CBS 119918]|uniref:NmrA-like domain-containing protein n=1 Tax=Exophiala aquamarina CBS 119918 TaxID=1182545 RepID=A0A072P9D6_9EURO|nr:uncharacterized protein A1O9_07458 [Exophiala aquamarina CBS 119918]KEF55878.1 hypothetical protein A1O9_07458 [Exophiala aquamarina CBS 119918]
MSVVKSVAVAGASGNLGPHIVKALVTAGLQVTVLTRSKKPGTYDSSVKAVEVDFTSVESLTAALQGIDGLVSTVTATAIENQTILIDAAIAAGVKRVIPSEFGSCTISPKVADLPMYSSMFKIKRYLEEQATAGKLTWTVLACGAFIDMVFAYPVLLDFANHKVTLYDKGDNRISSTSMDDIGKAIVGIFRIYEETKNKILRVSQVILTQNGLLKIAQELKPTVKWEISEVQTSVLLQQSLEEIKAGNFSQPTVMKLIYSTAFGGEAYGTAYDENDNQLLGIKELTEEYLKERVAKALG